MPRTLLRLALAAALFVPAAARADIPPPPHQEPLAAPKAEPKGSLKDVKTDNPVAPQAAPEAKADPKAEPKPVEQKPAAKVEANRETPVGRWKTIDDASKKEKSVVEIWEEGGKLYGKISQLLDTLPNDPNPKCVKCEGEQKDQPMIGMKIMWDLKKDGSEWSGGRILDPENGKTYKVYLALEDGGKKLKVRGYVGFSLLGRTQYWHAAP